MDYEKLYAETQDAIDRIQDEEIGVHFGSKEYDKAKKACQDVSQVWATMKDKTSGENV